MTDGPTVIGPDDGNLLDLAGFGVRFMLDAEVTGGSFSMVEHPLAPRLLAAPMHRHANEDEYSYVIRGRVGAKLGDDVIFGELGELIAKPRGQWHTFWNPGDEPASLIEIISPAGFEGYFAEMGEVLAAAETNPEAEELMGQMAAVAAKYELEMDLESIPGLCEEHGLRFGPSNGVAS